MDIRCADCGGNVWRSETTHRPGRDGRMLTTHTFVCDCCAEREDEVSKIIARERNNESIVAKNSQDMKAIADLQRQLEAERADHEATKKWLRRAHNLLGGLVK